jgi:adenylylsulfate kinase
MKRDPKGIYGRAAAGNTDTVPGYQASYEPPLNPDITLDGRNPPEAAADAVMDILQKQRYI